MSSLLDLAPVTREVTLRGKSIQFHGVTAEGLAALFDRFPDLKKVIQSTGGTISADVLAKFGPRLLAAAIAHAHVIDDEYTMEEAKLKKLRGQLEKAALGLSLGEQIEIVRAVLEVTFPGGIGPFVREIQALGLRGAVDSNSNGAYVDTGREQDTKLESPSPTQPG